MSVQIEGPLKEVKWIHMDSPNEAIPSGFHVCDGSTLNTTQQNINPGGNYTLPNLLNCFIIGADPTKSAGQAGVAIGNSNIDAAAGAPGPNSFTGSNQHLIVTAEMPSHNHGGGVHSHTINDSGHTHAHTLTIPNHAHSHSLTLPIHGHAHSLSLPNHGHNVTDPGHAHVIEAGAIGSPVGSSGNDWQNGAGPNNTDPAFTNISVGTPLTNPAISGTINNPTATPAIDGTINNPTTNPAISGTVTSATTGITATLNSSTIITSNGSDTVHENRPHAFGLVPIMRVMV